MKEDVKRKFLPVPSGRRVIACNPAPVLALERFWFLSRRASRVLQWGEQPSRWFAVDCFMTIWCSTPSAPGSYASRALAKVPTMILSETRGL